MTTTARFASIIAAAAFALPVAAQPVHSLQPNDMHDWRRPAPAAVQHTLAAEKLQTLMILQVHDELVLQVPEDELPWVRANVPQLMAGVAQLAVPLVADIGEGENWGAAH